MTGNCGPQVPPFCRCLAFLLYRVSQSLDCSWLMCSCLSAGSPGLCIACCWCLHPPLRSQARLAARLSALTAGLQLISTVFFHLYTHFIHTEAGWQPPSGHNLILQQDYVQVMRSQQPWPGSPTGISYLLRNSVLRRAGVAGGEPISYADHMAGWDIAVSEFSALSSSCSQYGYSRWPEGAPCQRM